MSEAKSVDSAHMMMVSGHAIAAWEAGEPVLAARLLEGLAADIRVEARAATMTGTARVDAAGRVLRYCGACGVGIVVYAGDGTAFRVDRRYCSSKCRQAAYRARHPGPKRPPKVIALGPG